MSRAETGSGWPPSFRGETGDGCFLIMWTGREFYAKFKEGRKFQFLSFFLSRGKAFLSWRQTGVAIGLTRNYTEVMGLFWAIS